MGKTTETHEMKLDVGSFPGAIQVVKALTKELRNFRNEASAAQNAMGGAAFDSMAAATVSQAPVNSGPVRRVISAQRGLAEARTAGVVAGTAQIEAASTAGTQRVTNQRAAVAARNKQNRVEYGTEDADAIGKTKDRIYQRATNVFKQRTTATEARNGVIAAGRDNLLASRKAGLALSGFDTDKARGDYRQNEKLNMEMLGQDRSERLGKDRDHREQVAQTAAKRREAERDAKLAANEKKAALDAAARTGRVGTADALADIQLRKQGGTTADLIRMRAEAAQARRASAGAQPGGWGAWANYHILGNKGDPTVPNAVPAYAWRNGGSAAFGAQGQMVGFQPVRAGLTPQQQVGLAGGGSHGPGPGITPQMWASAGSVAVTGAGALAAGVAAAAYRGIGGSIGVEQSQRGASLRGGFRSSVDALNDPFMTAAIASGADPMEHLANTATYERSRGLSAKMSWGERTESLRATYYGLDQGVAGSFARRGKGGEGHGVLTEAFRAGGLGADSLQAAINGAAEINTRRMNQGADFSARSYAGTFGSLHGAGLDAHQANAATKAIAVTGSSFTENWDAQMRQMGDVMVLAEAAKGGGSLPEVMDRVKSMKTGSRLDAMRSFKDGAGAMALNAHMTMKQAGAVMAGGPTQDWSGSLSMENPNDAGRSEYAGVASRWGLQDAVSGKASDVAQMVSEGLKVGFSGLANGLAALPEQIAEALLKKRGMQRTAPGSAWSSLSDDR